MTTSVLFVCVRNSRKSQMAAALMTQAAPQTVTANSAGTEPGTVINPLAAEVLAEVGLDITGEQPKPITPELLHAADLVVTLGREAHLDVPHHNWDTDEPSERGIDGIERMRLVRDDITRRITELAAQLNKPGD